MTLSNVDPRLTAYRDRIYRLEVERQERNEETRTDIADIVAEMKSTDGVTAADIRGVKLNVRKNLAELKKAKETAAKRIDRETAEQVSESLGLLADLPLGAAAVNAARQTPIELAVARAKVVS
jgi:uncharacterized protein (UPF0335 family)